MVIIPLLKPIQPDQNIQHKSDPHQTKNDQDYLEDLMCSRKESTAQGASEDSIESYSEAEEKEAPIRSESINSVPDDYGQFKTGLEPEPTFYHDSVEQDKIL
ncbi:hypothetical protein PGTUg99_004317 [Puccinia graminis f. sp. tritici]|uniref:Uncharacterized protein n=1 Tax=Puccinia graminis f. sp. tritici TaxID=56615 RepID=A0A5B0RG58_PUCGR|nr:hypothetical protein PGTUg99_004317 [Puccinia graminis f. sp. tritici]